MQTSFANEPFPIARKKKRPLCQRCCIRLRYPCRRRLPLFQSLQPRHQLIIVPVQDHQAHAVQFNKPLRHLSHSHVVPHVPFVPRIVLRIEVTHSFPSLLFVFKIGRCCSYLNIVFSRVSGPDTIRFCPRKRLTRPVLIIPLSRAGCLYFVTDKIGYLYLVYFLSHTRVIPTDTTFLAIRITNWLLPKDFVEDFIKFELGIEDFIKV